MKDKIMMCDPAHFEVSYEINPWMSGNVQNANGVLAQNQWNNLYNAISKVADVEVMFGEADLPDMVFTANAGTILKDQVILSRFKHPERQGEEQYFQKFFSDKGYHVIIPPNGMDFEGAGDALFDRAHSILWMGYGHRTNLNVLPLVRHYYHNKAVVPLELVDDRFYHLDTCFCPLTGGYVMYYPKAFSDASLKAIRTWTAPDRRIEVEEGDALNFACNAVNVRKGIFLNKASDKLVEALDQRGFDVEQIDLSEFMKAGGSAKCLTLKLNEQ